MNENVPTVTVLIPARPEQREVKAATASRILDYPADKLEIILARGKQPSVQRNAGIKAAKGELIYFLDDDSVPAGSNVRSGVSYFKDPDVKMLGGPNLCPPDAPWLEQVFALVLGSWLAFGPSRARYASFGQDRETSEKELILCNLMARRDSLIELGGFNEALYPNEENALMDELQKKGGKLMYAPDFIVYRRPRSSFKAFAKMLRTYGRGRAEQFRLHPTFGSVLNFVPPLFVLYLILELALQFAPVPAIFKLGSLAPLFLYVLILLWQMIAIIPKGGVTGALAATPLIALAHLLYGVGFWRGLIFTRFQPADKRLKQSEVVLEKISVDGNR